MSIHATAYIVHYLQVISLVLLQIEEKGVLCGEEGGWVPVQLLSMQSDSRIITSLG